LQAFGPAKLRARKIEIREPIQIVRVFQPVASRFFLRFTEISTYHNRIPPRHEGRIAIVTDVRRDAMHRMTCDACPPKPLAWAGDADGECVWSWHPWAGAKVAGDDPADDGD